MSSTPVPPLSNRVVVTGYGSVSPVGLTADETWSALIAGKSGIGMIEGLDTTDLPVHIGSEVKGFDPKDHLPHKLSRRIDTSVQYGLVAAMEAVEKSGLVIDDELAPRVGVYVGSSVGPGQMAWDTTLKMNEKGPRAVSPFFFATSGTESASGEIALMMKARGPAANISTACATGSTSIGEAVRLIRAGVTDVMIAGGAEYALTKLNIAAAAMCRALTRSVDPATACRPFDEKRDGFVMGNGAGVLVLENAQHALDRGATILAEVAGYGATTDAYHLTAPDPEATGTRNAMLTAMAEAGVGPEDLDYINAHGTSTELNDAGEVKAIRAVMGEHAEKVAISSTKSMTGHLISGTGAIELIASIRAIEEGVVPPTLNCVDPLDEGLNFVPLTAQERTVNVAMSNSLGFGGHNAVLVVRRWEDEKVGL